LNARVFCIIIDDKKYDLEYVLGMMNSKIVQFYLHKTAPLKAGGFYGYASKFLNSVPIPYSDELTRNQVIKKVKEAQKLKKQLQDQIEEFLDLLKTNLKTERTKRLSNFFELEFEELHEEFTKQKIEFKSIQKEADVRKFFIDSKIKTNRTLEDLKKVENEIEELSYSIYEMTDNEKSRIVEG
jgi:nucleoid DNA-binding protein